MRIVALGALLLTLYLPHVLHADLVAEDWTWMRALSHTPPTLGSWRPLTAWSLYSHTKVFPSVWVAHFANLSLHALLGAVLWRFLRRIGIRRNGAWAAVTLWCVHPVNIETVAYLSSRGELWAGLGIGLAAWGATGPPWVWLGVPLALALGVLGKESAIVGLPLVGLIWAYRREWPSAVVAAILTAGLGAVLVHSVNIGEASGIAVTWGDWLLLQASAAHRLFTMTAIPFGMTIDYDYDAVPMLWRVVALGTLGGIALLAWVSRHTVPLVSLGLAWMLIVMVPRLIIQTPRSYFNEHQFYAGLIGWAIVLGAGWDWLAAHEPPARGAHGTVRHLAARIFHIRH